MSSQSPVSPIMFFGTLVQHKELAWSLIKRDFIGRYKGSILGVVWSLFHPLLMLGIYTIVFSVAFKARWGAGEESKVAFAVVLFSGMIVHGFFAECLNRAPLLIGAHSSYVKKVVFPLDILSWMTLCSALMHFIISFAVLLLFCFFAEIHIYAGAFLIPLVILPLFFLTLGLSWLFAALGVYLRDLSHGVGIFTTVLLFLSPVFYPINSLPEAYRVVVRLNPITLPILQLRDLMLWNRPLDWSEWIGNLAIGVIVCYIGYWWFQKVRRGFADVL